MDAQDGCRGASYASQTRVTEHDPQSNPTCSTTHVYRVTHVTVEADNDQSLRRSKWCGRAVSRPCEIPHTAERNRESQHGGNRCQPSPTCCARRVHSAPLWPTLWNGPLLFTKTSLFPNPIGRLRWERRWAPISRSVSLSAATQIEKRSLNYC